MRLAALRFPMLLVLAAFALTLVAYPHLPERFAIHWDLEGHPNGYGSRPFAFILPVLMLGMGVLLPLLAEASPRGFELGQSQRVFARITHLTLLFLLAVHAFVLQAATVALHVDPRTFVLAALGLLLTVLGNYLGKVRRNFVLGIRTPWTLADDEVWLRTHRLGGRLMVAAGLFTLLSSFVPAMPASVLVAVIVLSALVPCVYSLVLYRKLYPSRTPRTP